MVVIQIYANRYFRTSVAFSYVYRYGVVCILIEGRSVYYGQFPRDFLVCVGVVIPGRHPVRRIEGARCAGLDTAHDLARGALRPEIPDLIGRRGGYYEVADFAVSGRLCLCRLLQGLHGVAVGDERPFVLCAVLDPAPRLARIGCRRGIDPHLRVGESIALVFGLRAAADPRSCRLVLRGRRVRVEPVLHNAVELPVDLREFFGQRVVDVILGLLCTTRSLLRSLMGFVGRLLGIRGRLVELHDVVLLLEAPRLRVVDRTDFQALQGIEDHTYTRHGGGHEQRLGLRVDDECAVQAAQQPLHVDVVQIGRIARHLKAEYREVREIAVLRRDVVGLELPVVYAAQITLIDACRVARRAARGIPERAVGHELHGRAGCYLRRVRCRYGSQLVFKLLVMVAQDLRDAEVGCSETREGAVTAAVIPVRGGILRSVEAVEDAHANVVHGNGAPLAFFQFERHQLLRGVHRGDDAAARRAPVVAHGDFDPVEVILRNREAATQNQAFKLSVPLLVDAASEACHAACEIRSAEAADNGFVPHLVGRAHGLVYVVVEEVPVPLLRIFGHFGNSRFVGIPSLDLLAQIRSGIWVVVGGRWVP